MLFPSIPLKITVCTYKTNQSNHQIVHKSPINRWFLITIWWYNIDEISSIFHLISTFRAPKSVIGGIFFVQFACVGPFGPPMWCVGPFGPDDLEKCLSKEKKSGTKEKKGKSYVCRWVCCVNRSALRASLLDLTRVKYTPPIGCGVLSIEWGPLGPNVEHL